VHLLRIVLQAPSVSVTTIAASRIHADMRVQSRGSDLLSEHLASWKRQRESIPAGEHLLRSLLGRPTAAAIGQHAGLDRRSVVEMDLISFTLRASGADEQRGGSARFRLDVHQHVLSDDAIDDHAVAGSNAFHRIVAGRFPDPDPEADVHAGPSRVLRAQRRRKPVGHPGILVFQRGPCASPTAQA